MFSFIKTKDNLKNPHLFPDYSSLILFFYMITVICLFKIRRTLKFGFEKNFLLKFTACSDNIAFTADFTSSLSKCLPPRSFCK